MHKSTPQCKTFTCNLKKKKKSTNSSFSTIQKHTHHKMVVQRNCKLNHCTSTTLKTNKHLCHDYLSVSMGVVFSLFHISSLNSTEHCCHARYSRPRSPLRSARERKERGREAEWEGGRRENLAFTVRDQRYIMGGQTILLHAVFLTNHYTTEQCAHILHKSKAACQALITIVLAAQLNRAKRKYVHSKSVL